LKKRFWGKDAWGKSEMMHISLPSSSNDPDKRGRRQCVGLTNEVPSPKTFPWLEHEMEES